MILLMKTCVLHELDMFFLLFFLSFLFFNPTYYHAWISLTTVNDNFFGEFFNDFYVAKIFGNNNYKTDDDAADVVFLMEI